MTPSLLDDPQHRAELVHAWDRLLEFAAAAADPHGGFGYLGTDGSLLPERPRELYITCRMTYVFSVGALFARSRGLDGDRWTQLAGHGLAALSGPFHDDEHGGWHAAIDALGNPLPGRKLAYQHAFVVLAAATASGAGIPGGADLLQRALDTVLEHFVDEGGVVESLSVELDGPEAYRGANATMHLVEALLAAADVDDRQDLRLLARSWAATAARQAEAHGWSLPEHYDQDWTPILDYNADRPDDPFRPFGVTPGHWLEWSRLILQAGPVDDPEVLRNAVALFDHAVDTAWEADGFEGFPYTLDFDGTVVSGWRFHWVLTEGIAAAAVLYRVTGEARFADWYRRFTELGQRRFADRETVTGDLLGSWRHELTAEGVESAQVWPGRPDAYHLTAALLCPLLPVAGSTVGALTAPPATPVDLTPESPTGETA